MNILFIPHVPNLKVINRVYEFAKNSNSYFLYWDMDNSNLKNKLLSQIKSFRFLKKDKIVQIPLLFKPDFFAKRVNTVFLNLLIKRLNIDVVVNANAVLFDIKSVTVPVFYDMVDDHLEENPLIGLDKNRVKKIKEDIKASKGVICVSTFLEKKVKELNKNTVTIENGVYIERFLKAKSLKAKYNLENKRVFGYIGGVEEWSGVEKAIRNYLKIKDDSTAFMVVGDSKKEYFTKVKKAYSDDILFIGEVLPQNVADFFKTLDVGVIPFELNDFTNNALPIKALEYALAGANVISTPLKYLKYKNFPFVRFCDMDDFANCMKEDFKEIEYDFSEYEWSFLAEKLTNFIRHSL